MYLLQTFMMASYVHVGDIVFMAFVGIKEGVEQGVLVIWQIVVSLFVSLLCCWPGPDAKCAKSSI